jgi:hypothetical protein
LHDAAFLQFFLPLIVDERIFACGYGCFGLLHLRPKIVALATERADLPI